MITIHQTGQQRFYHKYPDYPYRSMCGWRKIAEAEGATVEGELRECVKCDGRKYDCGSYTGR